jgi:tRNA-2-methylthio-N6-dimethylallyladenosine synthase
MSGYKVYIETYGCQMNEYDSEIVKSILAGHKYLFTVAPERADVILLNTCSVRENAHRKVMQRIRSLRNLKRNHKDLIIGVLGCMAQSLKEQLLENGLGVDIVAGPDNYRRLPGLLENVRERGELGYAVELLRQETYADILPIREANEVNAWVAVMRGCNNFCTFCVVPYVRGRERCRPPDNVVEEIRRLAAQGYKQITLLGQNVNSYKYQNASFATLIQMVSEVDGIERIRFTSPHPKDFPDDLLHVVAENDKVCKHIHLPLQAGNTRVLGLMNRTYTKEEYLNLALKMREDIPGLALTTDIIVGFPTETFEEYEDTLDVMRRVEFDSAFMFKYSERKGTVAAKKFPDDVDEEEKTARITRLVELQRKLSLKRNQAHLNETYKVLVEGPAKKKGQLLGRTDSNKIVVFSGNGEHPGDFVSVKIDEVTANTLIGSAVG